MPDDRQAPSAANGYPVRLTKAETRLLLGMLTNPAYRSFKDYDETVKPLIVKLAVLRPESSAARTSREVDTARREAEDALIRYTDALRRWNAPDDEHTRVQLRALIEDVIATMPEAT
jgi:hypothetical protein